MATNRQALTIFFRCFPATITSMNQFRGLFQRLILLESQVRTQMIASAAMLLQCRLWIFQMRQIEATQVAIVYFNFFNVLIANVYLCLRCVDIRFISVITILVMRMNAIHITDRVNRQEFVQIHW